MERVSHMLAESLASDNLWSALLFLAALVIMAGVRAKNSDRRFLRLRAR
jgi:hypothetical protein